MLSCTISSREQHIENPAVFTEKALDVRIQIVGSEHTRYKVVWHMKNRYLRWKGPMLIYAGAIDKRSVYCYVCECTLPQALRSGGK